jgi:hypothetical protein
MSSIEKFLLDQARKEGMVEVELEKHTFFTKNLLNLTDLNTSKIAALVGVSQDFVLKVKKDLNL